MTALRRLSLRRASHGTQESTRSSSSTTAHCCYCCTVCPGGSRGPKPYQLSAHTPCVYRSIHRLYTTQLYISVKSFRSLSRAYRPSLRKRYTRNSVFHPARSASFDKRPIKINILTLRKTSVHVQRFFPFHPTPFCRSCATLLPLSRSRSRSWQRETGQKHKAHTLHKPNSFPLPSSPVSFSLSLSCETKPKPTACLTARQKETDRCLAYSLSPSFPPLKCTLF